MCYFLSVNILFPIRRSVIVGAGYIAVEMAGILSTLGSKTSLIIRQTGVRKTLYFIALYYVVKKKKKEL